MKSFPWQKQYPEGVPTEISKDHPSDIIQMLEAAFSKYADLPAYENMGKTFTYREIDNSSRDFAAFLQSRGLKKGDRIAIQMPNLLQYPIAMFGALRAGLIVVNTNPLYTPREMAHQFKDSGAKAVVVVANFAHHLEEVIGDTEIETVIVTELGDMLGGLKGALVNFVVKRIKKMVPPFSLPGAIKFKKALKQGAKSQFTQPEIGADDLAFLQYTGGTTGLSKGAQLSHSNIGAHTAMIKSWFKPLISESEQEIMITAIPLYHIFALSVNCIFMLHQGAKNVLITNPRDIKGFIKELNKHPFTLMTGVNTLFNALLNHPDFKSIDFSKLKGCIGGGMAVQDFVAKKWQEDTGTSLVEGYGLSETSPVLCCNPLNGTHKMGTIGLPVPSTEIAICDDSGKHLPQGEVGEICAKGPQVMRGYWNRDNSEVFFDKVWFRTGDIGCMDESGFFKIVDRKKDMINVSGFNVYPNEIENVVADHPEVLEVAAIGVPDKKSTEAVKIFVVKAKDGLTKETLIAYCRENLTGYKCPKYVEFKTELPKSNVGKILRRILRDKDLAENTYS